MSKPLTVKELASKTGFENPMEMIAALKELKAMKAGAADPATKEAAEAAIAKTAEQIAKVHADERNAAELNEIQAMQKRNLKSIFDAATPEEQESLVKSWQTEFPNADIMLELTGGAFQKAMLQPVVKGAPGADVREALHKINDMALTMTMISGGLKEHSEPSRQKWESSVARLKQSDLFPAPLVEAYRKAAADAWDTADAGQGAELLPTILSRTAIEAIYLGLRVAPLFERFTMPAKTFKKPGLTGRARAGLMSEATSDAHFYTNRAPQNMRGTREMTYVAQKLGVSQFFSYEIEDDAVIPLAETILNAASDGMGASVEDALINGVREVYNTLDNAGGSGNELWADTTAALGRDAWDGLRKTIASGQKTAAASLTTASLRTARSTMGRYGVDPDKLAWIVSTVTWIDVLDLAEVVTIDKYGPNATIHKGEIGKIDGIPIIISEYIYTNLNASGVYDNATTTKTVAVLVYRPAFKIGDRKIYKIEQDVSVTAQQKAFVATWRGDFRNEYSGEAIVANLYNLPGT
jgi:hypothetical protein